MVQFVYIAQHYFDEGAYFNHWSQFTCLFLITSIAKGVTHMRVYTKNKLNKLRRFAGRTFMQKYWQVFENIDQKTKTLKKVLPSSVPAYEEKKGKAVNWKDIETGKRRFDASYWLPSLFFNTLKSTKYTWMWASSMRSKISLWKSNSVAEIAGKGNVSGNVNVSSSTWNNEANFKTNYLLAPQLILWRMLDHSETKNSIERVDEGLNTFKK